MNEPNTPVERLFDRRYGLIYRPDEFLRKYLREASTIDPDLYYRVVGIAGDEKVVSGYELIIFAQLYVRETMSSKIRRIVTAALVTIRTVCGELFYGLVLYGRYYLPIAATEKH